MNKSHEQMIKTIIEQAKNVQDEPIDQRVLDAMASLDRAYFGGTTDDKPNPIGYGQTISQPLMVAMMTDIVLRESKQHHRICEIGAGSGYQVAILSQLFKQVIGIERIGALAQQAKDRLGSMHCDNVQIIHATGAHLRQSHLDAIILTCGLTGEMPEEWAHCLNDSGVVLAPYQAHDQESMQLMLWQKTPTGMLKKSPFDRPFFCRFVPFIAEPETKA